MPSLFNAYATGRGMRKPLSLSVDLSKAENTFNAEVTGGSEPYHTRLEQTDGEWFYHCDCPDFQFTFWPKLKEDGVNIGEFPVVEGSGKGLPRHISEYGMCKHLLATVDKMIEQQEIPPFS